MSEPSTSRSRPASPDDPLPGVQHVILVMSGKGGVGKSTTATNLAMALSKRGFRTGFARCGHLRTVDPHHARRRGSSRVDRWQDDRPARAVRHQAHVDRFLLDDPKSAVIWRGPMLHGALQQFLKDVAWGELDYLVLDLPPGTGDVALSLAQRTSVTGAVIVTTPQSVATDDVYKSVSMCVKVDIPVLASSRT